MHEPIEHDLIHDVYLCRIGGPGNVVLQTRTLHEMEQALDDVDLWVQTHKEVSDAGSSTQGWREHRNWQR